MSVLNGLDYIPNFYTARVTSDEFHLSLSSNKRKKGDEWIEEAAMLTETVEFQDKMWKDNCLYYI